MNISKPPARRSRVPIGLIAIGGLIFLSLSIAFAVAFDPPVVLVFAMVLVVVFGIFIVRGGDKRWLRILENYPVRIEGSKLIQEHESGELMGAVNLANPYEVTIPFRGNGEGIYEIAQGEELIELSSRAENAEYIVRNLLNISEWPPDGYLNPL